MNYHLSNPRLLDKSRAAYRRLRKWDLALPPLLPAAGKVEVTDAIRVILPMLDGEAVYTAVPVGGWRFELERLRFHENAPVGARAPLRFRGSAYADAKTAVAAVKPAAPAEFNGNSFPAVAQPAAKFAAKSAVQAKHHVDALLDLLCDLDSRADSLAELVVELEMRAHAAGAKPNNFVHSSNIAA